MIETCCLKNVVIFIQTICQMELLKTVLQLALFANSIGQAQASYF